MLDAWVKEEEIVRLVKHSRLRRLDLPRETRSRLG